MNPISAHISDPTTPNQVTVNISDDQLREWEQRSKEKGHTSLNYFIIDCVEGHITRNEIIKYLEERAKEVPWWKKRQYNF